MTYQDPYRLSTTPTHTPAEGPDAVSRGNVLRTLLWAVVVVSVVANTAASIAGAGTVVHLACGVVTVLAAGTLVLRGLGRRR
ncbi:MULTISPECIES: hypothetical protein [unclassified Streptomyces]|uniref:hypothetical protein n=1 Tax=unclassified Streptomyces TaxID=2593676 RepID=UPI00331D25B6